MMDPADFISLALKLSASSGEAERRSAASRAYYGAFHVARRFVTSCGIVFSSSAETHDKLPYCLESSQHDSLLEVSRQLKLLRRARNVADYDLDDSRFTSGFVKLHVAHAVEVVTTLAKTEVDLTIQGPMRSYATGVLRLHVRDES
jgi:hypothetical protein